MTNNRTAAESSLCSKSHSIFILLYFVWLGPTRDACSQEKVKRVHQSSSSNGSSISIGKY